MKWSNWTFGEVIIDVLTPCPLNRIEDRSKCIFEITNFFEIYLSWLFINMEKFWYLFKFKWNNTCYFHRCTQGYRGRGNVRKIVTFPELKCRLIKMLDETAIVSKSKGIFFGILSDLSIESLSVIMGNDHLIEFQLIEIVFFQLIESFN